MNLVKFSPKERGVDVVIHGAQKTIRGALAVISAENLGSLALGGFKESCSALKLCRHCMISKFESQTKVSK